MYKVTKRDCPIFGIGPYVCKFICDTASDISTLPTSISEGTGGKTAYDNQKCASGSIAIVAENGAESKQYMLNNQNIWCPYSVAVGNSGGDSSGSSITVDFALSETSENPVANKVIVAALNDKADIAHTHSVNEIGADASGSAASALEEAKAYTDSKIADAMVENQMAVEALNTAIESKANKTDIPDLSAYAKTADIPNIKVNAAVNADKIEGFPAQKLFCQRDNLASKDLNDCVELGSYFFNGINANGPSPNGTISAGAYVVVDNIIYNKDFIKQTCQFIHGGSAYLGRMFIRYYDMMLACWSEWKEIYTEASKPYITGSATVAANSGVCVTNHGFTPSAVIWWDGDFGGVAVSFSNTQFVMNSAQTTERTVNYLIFK